ncbi:MAG: aldehyde dehydrogenase family protein [Verrucomicrobia bacterium]|nr:aldehyde dehydrogenase family protein [Verrucomicrobiota bacterium]
MAALPHLPALRRGKPYASLDQVEVKDCRTGEALARLSQVNAGIIRKDLARISEARSALMQFSCDRLLEICHQAAGFFLNESLPLGDQGHTQTPQQYVETLSATSGLSFVMVRRNMEKVASALRQMRTILNSLTRGLDLGILDRGLGEQAGARISFYAASPCLGLVMPSNSPGVNSLWLPAIPLKIPVILKPGREEPWTPYRIIQALIAAGCPAQAFGFYPTDHEGSAEILRGCGRALVFGDKSTTAQYANNPAIQVHGPGLSKILIGEDQIERWPEFIDLMVSSIADNGGRSCINASTVVVPRYAAEIADALAQKLGPLAPLPPQDETAKLAAFANPRMADSIDAAIEEGLRSPGAVEVTAKYRNGSRKASFEGAVYMRPAIVLCDSFAHPLANREFLFPYASVVQAAQADMLSQIGPSLVVTAITQDTAFRAALLESPLIDRLNLGPISTMQVAWDQPHEGNLFEFLYRRRALELA